MSTHNISFLNIKKKIILNYPKSATIGFFAKTLRKEFETVVENEPSVFEPLKFYCICRWPYLVQQTSSFSFHCAMQDCLC